MLRQLAVCMKFLKTQGTPSVTKQKIFTLISGETVRLSPQGRVIPAEDYAQALSAAELMEKVHAQIDAYKAEVAAECEKLKEQAQREGFEEGFAAWMDKIAELEQQVQQSNRATEKLILPMACRLPVRLSARSWRFHRQPLQILCYQAEGGVSA